MTATSNHLALRAHPDVERVVGHISLSFHPDDDPRMSNQLMIDLAREYMQRMEITGTQYLVMRHTDTKHPLLHILYNRVRTTRRWSRIATNACATCASAGSSNRSTD